jgi:predicted ATPase
LGWTDGLANANSPDTTFRRVAAGIVGVRAGVISSGGALSFIEQTAPSAPAANGVYIYAEDNGAGKTRLMAKFATGAAQQIAIEP